MKLILTLSVAAGSGPGSGQVPAPCPHRTGTMQEDLNEAGSAGYRFAGTQGGETAFGGREAVVIMVLDPEGR